MICLFLSSVWSNTLNNHSLQGRQSIFSELAAGLAKLREHHPLRACSPVGAGINLGHFLQHKDLPSARRALWFTACTNEPLPTRRPRGCVPSLPRPGASAPGCMCGWGGRLLVRRLMLLSRPLNFPLSPKHFSVGVTFRQLWTTVRECMSLLTVVGMLMEQNADASTEPLASPAVALCFIRLWSHKAFGQTGREDRQVVILY